MGEIHKFLAMYRLSWFVHTEFPTRQGKSCELYHRIEVSLTALKQSTESAEPAENIDSICVDLDLLTFQTLDVDCKHQRSLSAERLFFHVRFVRHRTYNKQGLIELLKVM